MKHAVELVSDVGPDAPEALRAMVWLQGVSTASGKENRLSEYLFSFRINKRDSLPIYLQIANKILSAIEDKSILPGVMLPSGQIICEHFGISKMTLRQAYGVLERKGYIEARRGVGTFVLGPRIEKKIPGMLSFSEEVRARGGIPSSKVLSITVGPANPNAQDFFCLKEGESVYEMKRLRFSDELPLAIEVVQLPQKLFRGFDRFHWAKESLYKVMEDSYGVKLSRSLSEIMATSANKEQAELLNLNVASPLLVINRKSYSTEDVPVEFSITCYPGSCYIATFVAVRQP
jgi:GntR family transcriptional regulator